MRDRQHLHHRPGRTAPESPLPHGESPSEPPEGFREHPERHPHHHGEHSERGGRNFWSEWRDERHHHGREEDFAVGQALSPKEMEAWREFFHQTFGTWPEDHWIFSGRRFSPWHQGIDSFNPYAAMLLSKGGGLLPLYALHLIAQKPLYGNEIMDLLAEKTHGQWVSNPGAVYPLLAHLEKEGFIEGKWEDPEKRTIRVYAITPAGQAELERIKMIVMPKLNETVQVLQELINDLQGQAPETPATHETPEPPQYETGAQSL